MTIEEKVYPKFSDFNNFQEYANHIKNSRDDCAKRGYHRVNTEPKEKDSTMICYDCEVWFDKEFAKSCDMNYRVEPI